MLYAQDEIYHNLKYNTYYYSKFLVIAKNY